MANKNVDKNILIIRKLKEKVIKKSQLYRKQN